MNAIISVASNELRRLFLSPFPWIIFGTVQSLLAFFFYKGLSTFMELASVYAGRSLTESIVQGLLLDTGTTMLFIAPFITMRLISEELRNGSIKLLLSSPLSLSELVLGKYLAIMIFFLCLLMIIALMPLSLMFGTKIDFGLFISGLFGLILLCSAFTSIGLFISSLSKSPALAALISFVSIFLFWRIHIANDPAAVQLQGMINYLSLQLHFNSLLRGTFSSVDVIYYVLTTTLFLVLSIWRLDAIRTHQ